MTTETPAVTDVSDSLRAAWRRASAVEPDVSAVFDLQAASRDALDVARSDPEAAGVLAPTLLAVVDRSTRPDATATGLWGVGTALETARGVALEALRWLDAGALVDAVASPNADWTVDEAVEVLLAATSAGDDPDRVRWTLEVIESLAWVAPGAVCTRGAAVVDWVVDTFDVDADRRLPVSLRVLSLVTRSCDVPPEGAATDLGPSLRRILQEGSVPSKLLAAPVVDALDVDLPSSLSEWATSADRHVASVLAANVRRPLDVLLDDLAAVGYVVAAIRLGRTDWTVDAPIRRTTHRERESVAETVGAQFVLDAFDFDSMVEQDGEAFLRMAALVGHAVSVDGFPEGDARALLARRVRTQARRGRLGAAVALGVLAKFHYDAGTREPMHARLEAVVNDEDGYLQSVAADALGFLVAAETATPLTPLIEDGEELTRLHAAGALGLIVAATDGTHSGGRVEFDAGTTALGERVAARYDPRVRTAARAGLVGVEAEALGFALAAGDRGADDAVAALGRAVLAAPDDYRQQYAVSAGIAHALGSDDQAVEERVATALRSSVGARRAQLAKTLGYVVRETGTAVEGPVGELALERATPAGEAPADDARSLEDVQALTTVIGEVVADRLAAESALIPLAEAVSRARGKRRRQRSMVRDAVLARLDDDTTTTAILERFVDQGSRYRETAVGLLRVVQRYREDDVGASGIDRLVALGRDGRDDAVVGVATELLETATARGLAAPAALEPGALSGDAEPAAAARAFRREPASKRSALLAAYRTVSEDDPERVEGYVPMLRAFVASEAPGPDQRLDAVAVLSNATRTAVTPAGHRGDSSSD